MDLSEVVLGGNKHDEYIREAESCGDLAVKARYLKNPSDYRPLLNTLNGPHTDKARSEKKLISKSSSTNPLLANPLLANPLLANPLLANPLLANLPLIEGTTHCAVAEVSHATPSQETSIPDEEFPNSKREVKRARRGQHKDRSSNAKSITSISEALQLCSSLAASNSCSYSDTCKFNHDRTSVLTSTKLIDPIVREDIKDEETCMNEYLCGPVPRPLNERYAALDNCDLKISITSKFKMMTQTEDDNNKMLKCPYQEHEEVPFCPFGVNCCLHHHTNDQGENLMKDKGSLVTSEIFEATKFPASIIGLNDVTSDFKHRLKSGSKKKEDGLFPLYETFNSLYRKESQFPSESGESPSKSGESGGYEEHYLNLQNSMDALRVGLGLPERRPKSADFLKGKLILAPLTTVGNLPFRRLCTRLGADVTMSEMALARSLLAGQNGEHALLKRHPEEKCFGIQIAGGFPDEMIKVAEMLEGGLGTPDTYNFDFVDINMGCPLEPLHKKFGGGSVLMSRKPYQEVMIRGMTSILSRPVTVKFRNSHFDKNGKEAHKLAPKLERWGVGCIFHHGRSSKMRYTGHADWSYINDVANSVRIPVVGNGDIYSPFDVALNHNNDAEDKIGGLMIGRGALIKPWIFQELKENKIWDISSSQRLEYLKQFCSFGLDHWGSDFKGVETTRRFLLESQSFLHRYTPVGLLERQPAYIQGRPPSIQGRDELETMMASSDVADWVSITELILGKAPDGLDFIPKHKSNSYAEVQG
eukprot:GHVH01010930.1.p1 GENE.GHVH01010930.1~~GHVH01010930.1.p1  ORF type:complete len:758 (-),score=103.42 GHVH01010930.1:51-2324(-)